jgi:hypothetical protein
MQTMSLNKIRNMEENAHDVERTNPEDEIMMWYIRLAHMPLRILIKMAENGGLSERLSKCAPSKCLVCMYSKDTKIPAET